jgi:hypothetical protein
MTAAFIEKKVGFVSGLSNDKLRRDIIIGQTDGGMPALFDFKNDYVRNGKSGALASGIDLLNLVDGADAATTLSAFATGIITGGLRFLGAGERIQLPDSFKMPTDATKFGWIIWTTVDALQDQMIGAGSTGAPIAGYTNGTSTENQALLTCAADTGSGAVTSLQWYMDGQGYGYPSPAAIADTTTMHQFACSIEISGGNKLISRYLDGALIGASTTAFDGSINQPSTGSPVPSVGYQPGYINKGYKGTLGRIGFWDGEVDSRTFAEVVAAEWARYSGRFDL